MTHPAKGLDNGQQGNEEVCPAPTI